MAAGELLSLFKRTYNGRSHVMPFPRLRALSGSYSNFFRPFENRKRTKDYDDVATHLKINKVLDKGLLFVDRQSTLT